MSRFSGPQPGYKDPNTRTKGVERRYREQKKLEAEVRDELLAPDDPKRRAVRLATLPEPDTTTRKRRRTRKNPAKKELECNCGASMVDGGMSSAHLDWCNLTPSLDSAYN